MTEFIILYIVIIVNYFSRQMRSKRNDGFFFKTEFQRKTIFLLTEIRDLLQNSQRTEAHSQLPGSEFNFSVVDTIDDLNSFERSLEDKDFRTKMVCL